MSGSWSSGLTRFMNLSNMGDTLSVVCGCIRLPLLISNRPSSKET